MANRIKKGDQVVVLTGRDKGRKGEVLRMVLAENRAIVQGVNMIKRHQRQSQSQEGGVISKESPIQLSNIALLDPKSGTATKVGFKFLKDGRKVRVARKSGEVIDV